MVCTIQTLPNFEPTLQNTHEYLYLLLQILSLCLYIYLTPVLLSITPSSLAYTELLGLTTYQHITCDPGCLLVCTSSLGLQETIKIVSEINCGTELVN